MDALLLLIKSVYFALFRDGKWPTLFSEGWNTADTFFFILESFFKGI